MKALTALTDNDIKGAKPRISSTGKPMKYELVDSTRERGIGRLVVRISVAGSKEFAYKYKVQKKVHYIQLGRYPSMDLAEARREINSLIKMLKKGLNPKDELKRISLEKELLAHQESTKGSIKQLFIAYTDNMKREGKRTYSAVFKALEKETYPIISPETKAKDVSRQQIVIVISKLIQRDALVQSNRVRSFLMAAFNYGLKHDNNPAFVDQKINFGIINNPVAGVPKQGHAEKVGDRYLTWSEVKAVLSDFMKTPRVGFMSTALIKLCIFTGGQRPYELSASLWENVDWNEQTLLIHKEVSKTRNDHLVPLSNNAINILKELKAISKGSIFIFPHSRDLNKHYGTDSLATAVSRFVKNIPGFDSFIPRDIRRTTKTLMGMVGITKFDRDKLQNHALKDTSSKHYDRYDYIKEKRNAIDIWERKLVELMA
jgi:integrase